MKCGNIALIGFMGSGKTTVGKLLAQKMGYGFIDMDDIIEDIAGKSIVDIFKQDGEPVFREIETKVLKDLRTVNRSIISTGGGVVLKRENVKILRSYSVIVYLYLSLEKIIERLKNTQDRPLINKPNREKVIGDIFNSRKMLYENASDLIINTEDKNPIEIVEEIVEKLGAL